MKVREKAGKSLSKSRLAKAAGAEPVGQMRDKKLHAVVARSTFPSQNVQSTPVSDSLLEVQMSHAVVLKSKVQNRQVRGAFESSDVVLHGRCEGL